MPQVLPWYATAQQCFSDEYGSLSRGFLTSVFMLVVGLERVFHLDEIDDPGFTLLTGGMKPPQRHPVGAWRRHLLWNEVDRFCHRTSPWELVHDAEALVSYDEHSIPRWTKKFAIPKGFVTTRNKYMRCEKLYYAYDVRQDRFLTVKGTPGKVELRDVSGLLLRRVLRYGKPAHLHALFDAGAGKSDANVRELMNMAADTPNLDVTLRACRYPHRVKLWKALPDDSFTVYEEPGVCKGAPPKLIRLAETRTVLKDETEADAVRTIVCHEMAPGANKDRWHPLYSSCSQAALPTREALDTFRERQHHEQGYRVEVHDEFLDATTCGYDKQSPDREHPRFCRGPLQMIGWLVALVYNACGDLAAKLGPGWSGRFVRTLRRTFFNRPGRIYMTPTSLIVYFDREPFYHDDLIPLIDHINAQRCRIPWLNNRVLVLSLPPSAMPRAGP